LPEDEMQKTAQSKFCLGCVPPSLATALQRKIKTVTVVYNSITPSWDVCMSH